MTTPDPKGRAPNPIACVTTWLGGLFRGPTPRYLPAPPPPAPEVAPVTRLGAVARVAAIDATRTAAVTIDGAPCDGPIAALTLVVDDAATAATVLEALHTGAHLRVAVARCGA